MATHKIPLIFQLTASIALTQDLLIGEVFQVGRAGGDTYSVFSTLTQLSNYGLPTFLVWH